MHYQCPKNTLNCVYGLSKELSYSIQIYQNEFKRLVYFCGSESHHQLLGIPSHYPPMKKHVKFTCCSCKGVYATRLGLFIEYSRCVLGVSVMAGSRGFVERGSLWYSCSALVFSLAGQRTWCQRPQPEVPSRPSNHSSSSSFSTHSSHHALREREPKLRLSVDFSVLSLSLLLFCCYWFGSLPLLFNPQ